MMILTVFIVLDKHSQQTCYNSLKQHVTPWDTWPDDDIDCLYCTRPTLSVDLL